MTEQFFTALPFMELWLAKDKCKNTQRWVLVFFFLNCCLINSQETLVTYSDFVLICSLCLESLMFVLTWSYGRIKVTVVQWHTFMTFLRKFRNHRSSGRKFCLNRVGNLLSRFFGFVVVVLLVCLVFFVVFFLLMPDSCLFALLFFCL